MVLREFTQNIPASEPEVLISEVPKDFMWSGSGHEGVAVLLPGFAIIW